MSVQIEETELISEMQIPDYYLRSDCKSVGDISKAPKYPVIVFINTRSGGQLGEDLLKTYRTLLNPFQIFDLDDKAPHQVLNNFLGHLERLKADGDNVATEIRMNLRIIVAGGDGTAGWLLGTVSDLKHPNPPPIATVPLGTGNNLPFSFGWGKKNPGTDRESVKRFMVKVMNAKSMKVDSWQVRMTMRIPAEGPLDPVSSLELPHALHMFKRVSQLDELNEEGYHTLCGGFWNYFSLGMDSQVSYAFHTERKLHPRRYRNQLMNQIEQLETNCELAQLEGKDVDRGDLYYFSDRGRCVHAVGQIHDTDSRFQHTLAKTINNLPPKKSSFLPVSLHQHGAITSSVDPAHDDHEEFKIRAVSGEDENSNMLWPLERLRVLLGFHTNEKLLSRSPPLEISALHALAPAELPTTAVSPSPTATPPDKYDGPSPSPSLITVLPSDRHSPFPLPTHISNSPPIELLGKKSGNTKTVVMAVVITAISTFALAGVFFYFYQKCATRRHGSNEPKDDRPLLFPSMENSMENGSVNHFYGESNGFNWGTVENSTGNSHKVASLETGKAGGMQLSSFNEGNHLRISPSGRDISSTQPPQEVSQIHSTVIHPSSSASPVPFHALQNTAISPALPSHPHSQPTHTQIPSSCEPPSLLLPPDTPSAHSPVKSTSPPPPPPPPPINKSPSPPPLPPMKKSPSPPPSTYKSPSSVPGAPANGKSNLPIPPPTPAKNSKLPPPLPPRSKAGQPMSSAAQSAFGTGVSAEGEDGNLRPKLKPFHWEKVQANSDHSMVWDKIRAGSFQFNEEMIETLFGYNSTKMSSGVAKQSVIPPSQNLLLLDPKKSQNLAILLRALNVTKEEVCHALFEGEGLSPQLLETLVKMAPTKDEERKLKDYNGDISKLGPAERFLKALVNIPFAFERFDAMLYRENFREEVSYIRESYETLEAGCKELRCSRLFLKLLEAVLKTGNRMNVGTYRGGAHAFKLDTLLKLADVKGTDGKTTLLHFVVQEIVRAEGMRAARAGEQSVSDTTSNIVDGQTYRKSDENESSEDREDYYRTLGLQVLANLSTDLCNLKKAAAIDSHALTSSVSKLTTGLAKMKSFLRREFSSQKGDENASNDMPEGIFHKSMALFLQQAEEEISQLQSEEKRVLSRVKEITEYFHGDAAKEEAHPFRIFVIVRDFTNMLDQVCKQVGSIQKRNPPSSSQKGPSSISDDNLSHALFPTVFDRNVYSADDESSTP